MTFGELTSGGLAFRSVGAAGVISLERRVPKFLIDLVRYGAVSILALACDCGLLYLLVRAGLHYVVASTLSFSAGMGVAYLLSARYVFADRRSGSRDREVLGFVLVGVAGLLLTQVLLAGLVSGLGVSVAIAKILTAGTVFIFNFVCRRSLVFEASDGAGRSSVRTILARAVLFRSRPDLWPEAALGVLLAATWGLGHTFGGIELDARIYMGRALADLDPAGAGRDLMFRLDGQSAFTVFGALVKVLVASFGAAKAAAVLTIAGTALWFVAMVTLVRGLAPGRALALVLAAVVLLPRPYGPWGVFSAGEALAVPRPFAEAGVILALAALCRGRPRLGIVSLVAAALVHPIMAAPGFCIFVVVLGLEDRRWFLGAALVVGGAVAAAMLGAPVASRIFAMVDRPWHDVLAMRNAYLFLHLWSMSSWMTIVVQVATLLAACAFVAPRARAVFATAVGIGLLGCAISVLFCDVIPDLLVTQAQLWRWLWPTAALAPVGAGICLWHLPQRGPRGQVALACLCVSWLNTDTALAAAMALLAIAFILTRSLLVQSRHAAMAWAIAFLLCALTLGRAADAFMAIVIREPRGGPLPWGMAWSFGFAIVPIALAVVVSLRWPTARMTRIVTPLVALGSLVLFAVVADARTTVGSSVDAAKPLPDLIAMLASRPGEVLWVEGDEVWQWARRPHWNAPVQGAGLVFSSELARIWIARAQAVVDAGLASRQLLDPWDSDVAAPPSMPDAGKVAIFCRRSRQARRIVTPLNEGLTPPPSLAAKIWRAPTTRYKLQIRQGTIHWRSFDTYLVIPCAQPRAPA